MAYSSFWTGALGAGVSALALPPACAACRAVASQRPRPGRTPPLDAARWLHQLFLKLSSFSVVPRNQGAISTLVKTGGGRFPSWLLAQGAVLEGPGNGVSAGPAHSRLTGSPGTDPRNVFQGVSDLCDWTHVFVSLWGRPGLVRASWVPGSVLL